MFTLECPECKQRFEHEKEIVAKRMLGGHRSNVHGYQTAAARRQWLSRHPGQNPPGAKPMSNEESLQRAREARWGKVKTFKTTEKYRERARARYHALKNDPTAKGRGTRPALPTIAEVRADLQKSSWWSVEDGKRTITCPCCEAQFVIIRGSK